MAPGNLGIDITDFTSYFCTNRLFFAPFDKSKDFNDTATSIQKEGITRIGIPSPAHNSFSLTSLENKINVIPAARAS